MGGSVPTTAYPTTVGALHRNAHGPPGQSNSPGGAPRLSALEDPSPRRQLSGRTRLHETLGVQPPRLCGSATRATARVLAGFRHRPVGHHVHLVLGSQRQRQRGHLVHSRWHRPPSGRNLQPFGQRPLVHRANHDHRPGPPEGSHSGHAPPSNQWPPDQHALVWTGRSNLPVVRSAPDPQRDPFSPIRPTGQPVLRSRPE